MRIKDYGYETPDGSDMKFTIIWKNIEELMEHIHRARLRFLGVGFRENCGDCASGFDEPIHRDGFILVGNVIVL